MRAKQESAPRPFVFTKKPESYPQLPAKADQRDFTPDAELYLAVIAAARSAGFTIAEIRLLFHGFRESTPASARWRTLARKKYDEINLQISRLHSMQKLLRNSMRCHCIKLEDCGRIVLSRRNSL